MSTKIPRGAAVVVEAGKVLVVKRYLRQATSAECVMCEYAGVPGPECAGHRYAVLPGGHVEEGESAAGAALRELEEETTLTGRIDRLLWTGTHNGRPAYYFLVDDVSGVPELSGDEAAEHGPSNHFELRWADSAELADFGMYPAALREQLVGLLEVSGQAGQP
ncbi:NUDIX hydrolase [Kribbella shirazensis]|uniref:ADP-ribose pyrophosphatase YjhB (NUDIX family) n=1 Tax=Kribbella shirazensis TaxID=1105143 RepID=A0A7X5VE91_9ACTN|nr:NUDIX domain-containing protein [Kribbella shirazensis]NIK59619.1 ADP-ribose pyrophosphatase YjhB (NUDIX family) [Kribbella shirazensis]